MLVTTSLLTLTSSVSSSCCMSAMAMSTSSSCPALPLVPALVQSDVDTLLKEGIAIIPIDPLGATVTGMDVRNPPSEVALCALEHSMAFRGFIVITGCGVLTPNEQIQASCLFGGRQMHSTHGVHPATPDMNEHIFRLSNDPRHGTLGVGPQWHNDGSFTSGTFSHVSYHIVQAASIGGGTFFSHQGAAFDLLTASEQEAWSRYVSVNSNSGVLHPLVQAHPVTGRKVRVAEVPTSTPFLTSRMPPSR